TVIVNTSKEHLTNAVISDVMGENQKLQLDSLELYEVTVDLQGNVVDRKEPAIVLGDMNLSTEQELKIALGDTNKAYQLIFKSEITDNEGTAYPNTATLDSDGKNTDSDDATIYVGRHESLTKKSVDYKPGEQSVQWEVNVNFNEKKMEIGQKIEDTFTFSTKDGDFTDIFEIKEESIEIIEVQEFNEDGTIKESKVLENNGELFTVEITEGSITYTLEKESNKAYIFRYHTKVKEDAYITEGGKITNTVRFDGKTKISEQGIIQQVGKKSHGLINYENKTIDWTIIINADKQDLRN